MIENKEIQGLGEVALCVDARYKRLSIKVGRDGVIVQCPLFVNKADALKFAESKKEWIVKALSNINNRDVIYLNDDSVFMPSSIIRTCIHQIEFNYADVRRLESKQNGNNLNLLIPRTVDNANFIKYCKRYLFNVLKMECDVVLRPLVRDLAERYGFSYKSLSYRNNVSNWGSCSCDNRIVLNINLMRLPIDVYTYVVLHELCHTREHNHSKSFWDQVALVCPQYEDLRRRLKKYSLR